MYVDRRISSQCPHSAVVFPSSMGRAVEEFSIICTVLLQQKVINENEQSLAISQHICSRLFGDHQRRWRSISSHPHIISLPRDRSAASVYSLPFRATHFLTIRT